MRSEDWKTVPAGYGDQLELTLSDLSWRTRCKWWPVMVEGSGMWARCPHGMGLRLFKEAPVMASGAPMHGYDIQSGADYGAGGLVAIHRNYIRAHIEMLFRTGRVLIRRRAAPR